MINWTIGKAISMVIIPFFITSFLIHNLISLIKHGELKLNLFVVFFTNIYYFSLLP